jgi:hypothetical protein
MAERPQKAQVRIVWSRISPRGQRVVYPPLVSAGLLG